METHGNPIGVKKVKALTLIGIAVFFLLTLTKIVPSTKIAGYSVLVGIAFFIVKGVANTPDTDSVLRLKTFVTYLENPGVLLWMLLPIVSAIATLHVSYWIFGGDFSAHVVGRTEPMLSFDKLPLLAFRVVAAAFGEEIAFSGFFVGKTITLCPFWLCALVSSALFAAGHIATGHFALVFFDIATFFIDSLLFAVIFKNPATAL